MIQLYNTIFYEPLFNLLIWLYNVVPGNDIGLAIIILTILIRVVLFPLYYQSIRSQRALQEIQPKVNELKRKYKDEKEKMSKEMMILYKNEKVNPFSSCLPLVIQLPFLFAVYQVFRSGLNSDSLDLLYPFISNPGHINSVSLGFIDLAVPSVILAFLAGSAQFWQAKMMVTKRPPLVKGKEIDGAKDEKMMATMNKQMVYFMPFITVIIGISLPAGLTLYWFITTLLMALQQLWMFKKKAKIEPTEPTDIDIEKTEEPSFAKATEGRDNEDDKVVVDVLPNEDKFPKDNN
jgi:YidC/Oxa1 family membrane protein insertase